MSRKAPHLPLERVLNRLSKTAGRHRRVRGDRDRRQLQRGVGGPPGLLGGSGLRRPAVVAQLHARRGEESLLAQPLVAVAAVRGAAIAPLQVLHEHAVLRPENLELVPCLRIGGTPFSVRRRVFLALVARRRMGRGALGVLFELRGRRRGTALCGGSSVLSRQLVELSLRLVECFAGALDLRVEVIDLWGGQTRR